ncbi:MAG TPA: hypothetical protein VD886_05340 [Herpetosiphonaceae bacterium]|nr:hypothetical protein [Herpetosiphonaceae bacterium]
MEDLAEYDDVTHLFLAYREAVRHLWKTAFAPREDAELPWLFGPIEAQIFYALIVWELGRDTDQAAVVGDFPFGIPGSDSQNGFGHDPFPYLHVIPRIAPLGTRVTWLSETPQGGVGEAGTLHTGEIDLRFVDFDDTSIDAYSDWRWYRARVFAYPADPAREGGEVLLDVEDARIMFKPLVWESQPAPGAA